ncbi:MAG: cytidine deaminase [Flavobacteriaceae bacterium]
MKKRTIAFDLTVYDALGELSEEDCSLMQAAVTARHNAYAPYSNFHVGAAVLLENGKTVVGNNQENASYPSGLCAERVAVFYAGANFPGVAIKTIAISATSKQYEVQHPAAPCGNCRQSISEYELKQNGQIALLLMGESGQIYKCSSVADLLPLAFDSTYLK